MRRYAVLYLITLLLALAVALAVQAAALRPVTAAQNPAQGEPTLRVTVRVLDETGLPLAQQPVRLSLNDMVKPGGWTDQAGLYAWEQRAYAWPVVWAIPYPEQRCVSVQIHGDYQVTQPTDAPYDRGCGVQVVLPDPRASNEVWVDFVLGDGAPTPGPELTLPPTATKTQSPTIPTQLPTNIAQPTTTRTNTPQPTIAIATATKTQSPLPTATAISTKTPTSISSPTPMIPGNTKTPTPLPTEVYQVYGGRWEVVHRPTAGMWEIHVTIEESPVNYVDWLHWLMGEAQP